MLVGNKIKLTKAFLSNKDTKVIEKAFGFNFNEIDIYEVIELSSIPEPYPWGITGLKNTKTGEEFVLPEQNGDDYFWCILYSEETDQFEVVE